jgi:hypothetical protein
MDPILVESLLSEVELEERGQGISDKVPLTPFFILREIYGK